MSKYFQVFACISWQILTILPDLVLLTALSYGTGNTHTCFFFKHLLTVSFDTLY